MEIYAKKSLGQHFLNSPSVLAKIIEAARLSEGETVLEIGPGTGILTDALLKAGVRVIAVEKDDRAYQILKVKFFRDIETGKLELHRGDILESDRGSLGFAESNYAVVANIPYYITGAILESFLEHGPRPNRMVLLVQKEVADRIVAHDGKESILSISVKAFGEPKFVAKVPKGAFSPPPTVDSAILSIDKISDTKFAEMTLEIRVFFDILKAGFAHKRKFLKRNLEEKIPRDDLDKIWTKFGLNEKVRAEDLRLDQWFEISNLAR